MVTLSLRSKPRNRKKDLLLLLPTNGGFQASISTDDGKTSTYIGVNTLEHWNKYRHYHDCLIVRTCSKTPYDTRPKAQQAANSLMSRSPHRQRVYQCAHCHKFHFGREWSEGKAARQV